VKKEAVRNGQQSRKRWLTAMLKKCIFTSARFTAHRIGKSPLIQWVFRDFGDSEIAEVFYRVGKEPLVRKTLSPLSCG